MTNQENTMERLEQFAEQSDPELYKALRGMPVEKRAAIDALMEKELEGKSPQQISNYLYATCRDLRFLMSTR